jgi:hypothetical protein
MTLSLANEDPAPGAAPSSGWRAVATYVGRIREFQRIDWVIYLAWVGLVGALAVVSAAFLAVGVGAGAAFPAEAFLVPIGAAVFTLAIAVDTVGHRTIYKQVLRGGEALVHHITIVAGIGSCVFLCLAYPHRPIFGVPALVLTAVCFLYSLIDEVLHWRRYLTQKSDVVEMWSHVFILLGHGTMMLAWWIWYADGYAGVAATLLALGA